MRREKYRAGILAGCNKGETDLFLQLMNNSLGKSAKLKKNKIKTIYSAFTQFGGSDNIGYVLFKR